ncbi:flagellin [Luteimonas sp. S4-F44]|uniref:flagellin N-terminal helical domain-containing protein n=1 Tax=Luteimonas sp. S4-F44 TaxID=2925842 RepID=UPI002739A845|nr:flagellin [Luteimonas sp. S4-F44]
MSVINTNTISLNAQRNLSTNSASLSTTIQRLSSGLRINSAKDDAAGLAISERFSTQIRGANQAARNANDGISLAQTAEGALGEIGNNLQRIRELSVQSRNATNSDTDRAALNAEVQLLKSEIQRVAEQTNFNGKKLLDGSFQNQAFQVGANQGQTISVAQIANANISKLGNWNEAATAATVTGVAATGGADAGGGAATPGTLTFDTAGVADPEAAFTFSVNGTEVEIAAGAGRDAEALATAIAAGITDQAAGLTATAADGVVTFSNASDAAVALTGAITGSVAAQTEAGTFTAGSFTLQGVLPSGDSSEAITISYGAAGSASERASNLVTAINNQSYNTGVTAALDDNGNVALSSANGNFTIGASAGDDAAGLLEQTGLAAGATTNFAEGAAATGFAQLDISSERGAENAILAMDAALNSVNSARADLGAVQNRFSSVVANLQTGSENLSAARSRIVDTDFAKETAELSRTQILQQAGTAMLAQANQIPQNVLSLLR